MTFGAGIVGTSGRNHGKGEKLRRGVVVGHVPHDDGGREATASRDFKVLPNICQAMHDRVRL